MPEYEVTDPNTGQTLVLTGDQPPTEQELEQVFSQYGQPTEQPGVLGQLFDTVSEAVTGAGRATPQTEQLPELQESGLLASEDQAKVAALSPVLLTTTDPNEISDIITQNFPNVGVTYNRDAQGNVFPILVNNETGAATVINRPGLSGIDVLQGLGIGAAFTPAGRGASALAVGAKSAGTEAGLQAAQEAAGGEFDAADVALAGGGAAAAKGLEDVASAVYRGVRGQPGSDIVQAGAEAGIPVMTSDVLPPETFAGRTAQRVSEKVPFIGTGGQRRAQQEFRSQAVEEVAEKYGQFSYDTIVQSLKDQSAKVKTAAGNVLENTGNKLDGVGEIPMNKTQEVATEVRTELARPGVITPGSALEELDNLLDTLDAAPQTFTSLRENRTAFREILKGVDKADRTQLTSRTKSLLQRVENAMKSDMSSFARENLTGKEFNSWNKANSVYAREAEKLTKSRLKNVLDRGDVTPENVQTLLFSQKPSEVNLLYKGLTNEGRANARSAIISKVVEDVSKRRSGFTPNAFLTEMKKRGLQTSTFFKGEDKKQLNGLLRVLDATERAQEAAVTTPTGQETIGVAAAVGLAIDPLTALGIGGTVGTAARIYESPPVRNALLRLASIPKGSTRFEQALTEATEALTAAGQSVRAQQSESEPQPGQ